MTAFPPVIDWSNWGSLMLDTELFTPLIRKALAAHGLQADTVRAGFPGTNAVFVIDDTYVVKIYAPLEGLRDGPAERACYRLMYRENMPLTPRLFGEGVIDGWEYIIMEYLPGEAIRDVFDTLSDAQKERIGTFVGEWAAKYHTLPDPFPQDDPLGTGAWQTALLPRIDRSIEKLRSAGCREGLLAELRTIVKEELRIPRETVLTDCDLTEDHLLIAGDKMRLIDFADSRMAFACLEWPPLWFGMLRRDRSAFAAYLARTGESCTVREQLFACLLHWYGAPILLDSVPALPDMHSAEELLPFLYTRG